MFLPTENIYSARNGAEPKEAEEPYLHPFVSKMREIAKPVSAKVFLQPAKAVFLNWIELK